MPDTSASPSTPQFGKAEYSASSDTSRCALCQQTLGSAYYRVKQAIACEACALKAKMETPADSHSAFLRAVIFGVGAAILGMAGYAFFTIVTGIYIGYISLAVGWFIGKAMKTGSGGFGGRRYQITAVLLTYAAVSIAAIPISIAEYAKNPPPKPAVSEQAPQVSPAEPGQQNTPGTPAPSETRPSLVSFIVPLLLLGLASPFLDLQQDPLHGGIGLIILFVGMRFAWRFTAGTETPLIAGPFANRAAPAAPPAPL
jgi:uncharacterized protein (DUF983 family)